MNQTDMLGFCHDQFWDWDLLSNNTWPEFTSCFTHTVLVWLPCGYVWLLLPYFLYDVHNPLSTNNLNASQNRGRRLSKPLFKTLDQRACMGGLDTVLEEPRTYPLTIICVTKVTLTLLLAVLSLVQLLFRLRDYQSASQVASWAVYLATYILVAFQLWYERRKGRQPLMISFYFYTMNLVLSIVPLYTWIITEIYLIHQTEFGVKCCSMLVNLICLTLSFAPDNKWWLGRTTHHHAVPKPCPEVLASYPSQIFFLWMTKLITTGFRRDITTEDLWELHPRDQGRRLNPLFLTYWQSELRQAGHLNNTNFSSQQKTSKYGRQSSVYYEGDSERTSLLTADHIKVSGAECPRTESSKKTASLLFPLIRLTWKNIVTGFVQKLLADFFIYMGPMILGALIDRLQNPEPDKIWQAYALSVVLTVTGLIRSVLFSNSMHRSMLTAVHAKTALINAVYRKALTISNYARKGSTVGEIVNLMSVDCQRIQDILTIIVFLFSTPTQTIMAIVLLYYTIGVSVLTGVALLLLLVPLNIWMGNWQKRLQEANLGLKDERLKMVNEVLGGIKVLKLYAWENEFKRKIEMIRDKEIKQLRTIALLYVITSVCWGIAPFLVCFVTFATFLLTDRNNVLDPQKAFVCLALFNLLKIPLFYVATFMTYSVQMFVSIRRLNEFLVKEDIDTSSTVWDTGAENAVNIQNGTFTWDRDGQPTLKNINLTIRVGQLTAIVGPVGSGKTSLISAILGDMEKIRGQVTVKGSVAYVSQQAWIQNATVRDNILFGQKFNKHRYWKVIKACELERDLQILAAGDLTEIGEKGINLSGGQKQRINLARAVYSGSDIFLFDDPLSAVDAHVGKAIFKNIVGPSGMLAQKTRIFVTHGVHWLPQVDDIVVLYNGAISEHGTYQELLSHNGSFAQFLQVYLMVPNNLEEEADSDLDSELQAVKSEMRSAVEKVTSDTSGDEFGGHTPAQYTPRRQNSRSRDSHPTSWQLNSPILVQESLELSTTLTNSVRSVHPVDGKLILDEKLEVGKVKRDVFCVYGRAAGLIAMTLSFFTFGVNQGLVVWSSFFLSDWTEDPLLLNASTRSTPKGVATSDYYMVVYGVFFGVTQFLTLIIFYTIFHFRLVRAADRMHHLLLDRLFHAPMSFFDQTPIGRILNRFSKDVDTVDNTLPIILRDWLSTVATILITIVVILIKSPIFGAVLVPICVAFYVIQNYYVRTSRQLKRIESVTRSPIYIHFSESISGAAVIRAYRATDRFIEESELRVDKNQIYFFASNSALRWMQLNMDLLGNLVIFFSAIFQITNNGGGSDAGLSVSYAMQITSCLAYMVRQISEFETNIVSVERIREYSQVEQEAAFINPLKRPAPHWPSKGNVTFENYQTRYRPGLELVLKGVSCYISGGQKVGIVGRTGAGKSSLTLALFRIVESASGSITIDGINIEDIGLHDLRGRLTILPQDPVIFSGTLRMNVDPFDQYSDQQLWTALERSHLKDFILSQRGSLMYECGEEGSNFSVGQRQLVCLARALLRRTKILILDEATAAVDMETDALIQKTIREAFRDCTIIAIAHRLNTIMEYDRIIVMDAGIIREFDTPTNLLNRRGMFYDMCRDAGLVL